MVEVSATPKRDWMDKALYIASLNFLVDNHVRMMRKLQGKFTPRDVAKISLAAKRDNVIKLVDHLNATGTECTFDSVVVEVSTYPQVIEAASLISEDLW